MHYCAQHGTPVLDTVSRDYSQDRQSADTSVDRCAVDIELVICDAREDHSCYVFLGEVGGRRRLAFPTGKFEAWTLSWELKREPGEWPGTHRAMVKAIELLGGTLTEVIVNDVSDDELYYCQVQITQSDSTIVVDMRPSDGLLVAVVRDLPIYVESLVWQKVKNWGTKRG
jgi:bifunctional DNase/RNase